jgi:hypothetical protein
MWIECVDGLVFSKSLIIMSSCAYNCQWGARSPPFPTCTTQAQPGYLLLALLLTIRWRARSPPFPTTYPRKKRPTLADEALHLEAMCSRGYRKRQSLFCGYGSRRSSSVCSLLLQDIKSPYVFSNFNGDLTTTETA